MSGRVVSVDSNSSQRRKFLSLIQHGREYCKWLIKLIYLDNLVQFILAILSNFAKKIEVEVYANQEKSLPAVTTLIKYVFCFQFFLWIIIMSLMSNFGAP